MGHFDLFWASSQTLQLMYLKLKYEHTSTYIYISFWGILLTLFFYEVCVHVQFDYYYSSESKLEKNEIKLINTTI